MNTLKTRHQFYLPDDLSEALDRLAATPGSSKTAILTDALRAWLDRKAGSELDQRFGPRFDRQQRSIQQLQETLAFLTEMLDLFVRHQMLLVAHQPAFDDATQALGRKRYDAFIAAVARRIGAKASEPNTVSVRRSNVDE